MDISVVGLGKLGSPMAACLAAKGHQVVGVDLNEKFVQAINAGKPPVFEPGLQEMLDQTGGRLRATADCEQAISQTELTFLIVPTPSLPNGVFSLKYVLDAAQAIGRALRHKDTYHVVVLTSTVMPGATGAELVPALEKASGKRCPEDFGVCYSPEFISLGSVIRDYLHPDFVLIGESDSHSGQRLADIYQGVCNNHPPVMRMNYVNAELTKLALNSFVTTKISYANMLAEICERLDGGDVDVVTSALGLDSRIGPKYLKGSTGFGGPCFPRDSIALASLARGIELEPLLPEATTRVNALQVPRLVKLVQECLPPGGKVGVLGLAYKPQTDVIERAQGVELVQALAAEGIGVVAYDPAAMDNAAKVVPLNVQFAASAVECARQADVVVVCTPCKEFKAVGPSDLVRMRRQAVVIDCWRLWERQRFQSVCHYIGLGTSDVMDASRRYAAARPNVAAAA